MLLQLLQTDMKQISVRAAHSSRHLPCSGCTCSGTRFHSPHILSLVVCSCALCCLLAHCGPCLVLVATHMLFVSRACQVVYFYCMIGSQKSNSCLKVWQSVVSVPSLYSWLHLLLYPSINQSIGARQQTALTFTLRHNTSMGQQTRSCARLHNCISIRQQSEPYTILLHCTLT